MKVQTLHPWPPLPRRLGHPPLAPSPGAMSLLQAREGPEKPPLLAQATPGPD